VPSEASNPARRLLSSLLSEVRWPDPLDSQNYGRHQALRDWLEGVTGLGLGIFDLIIIDEAHKSRGDESILTGVLGKVVLRANESRRVALTATPIELDVDQWTSTLQRIAIRPEQLESVSLATDQYADAIHRLRLGWRASAEVRANYVEAARQFEKALSPFLIRRDKREDEDVIKFARVSGLPIHDYRRQEEVSVEFDDLSSAWRQAVCAAEALSVIKAPTIDTKAKRLRLTIGNGHGISSVIDEALRDEIDDHKQAEFEASQSTPVQGTEASAVGRAAWWEDKLRHALASDLEVLFEHPAILAAVRNIEKETERGEKILVFGRFTRPLRALVSLLNARQMLLRIAEGHAWPQRKVHGDRNGSYGDSEWPAVLAAHRQLSSSLDLDTLDDILAERYRRDSDLRTKVRDALVPRIRAGLAAVSGSGKYGAVLNVVERQSFPATNDLDDDDRHLTLLSRAITANLDSSDASDADFASAFIALVNAASDRDNTDDEEFDEEQANLAWQSLEEHLREGYTNRQGGFARLMYGETKPQARRMMQLAFNRSNSFPHVLVAQSLVGREGLNLHESCRIVVLLHPEWNPGVVEQQIGRVDRVNCRWAKDFNNAINEGKTGPDLPRIEIRPVIFKGTYDEHNWKVLQERWDDLRAQLHGEAIPARLRVIEDDEGRLILDQITRSRPDFSPLKRLAF
jgi:ribosomal protein L17